MQAEAVHDRFFLYRVRTRLEHEGIGIQFPAVVHEADCEAAGFLVHLEVDFDPLRVAIESTHAMGGDFGLIGSD